MHLLEWKEKIENEEKSLEMESRSHWKHREEFEEPKNFKGWKWQSDKKGEREWMFKRFSNVSSSINGQGWTFLPKSKS